MSLINQMLRDLEEQKKGSPAQKPVALRPSRMARIPFLPLPLVLGAGGVLLLCLIWWLAGALSDWMFVDEGLVKTAPGPAQVQPADASKDDVILKPEADQLTQEERGAEPPEIQEKELPITTVTLTAEPVAAKPLPAPKKTAVRSAAVNKPPVPRPVKRPVVRPTAPSAVASQPVVRLHPDDLPGAVAVRSVPVVEPVPLPPRPSRVSANTPYGRAEEAYLDGLWALEKGHPLVAAKAFRAALAIYPGHLQARLVLAETLAGDGQAGEAMLILSEGLEIAPDYAPFKKSYARLLMAKGDPDAALGVLLRNGLPAIEDDPETHVILASLYQKVGEPFLAAQTYRNLLVVWPQTGAFWVGLGSVLENQKLWKDAIDCYRRALKTDNLRDDLSAYARKRLKELT